MMYKALLTIAVVLAPAVAASQTSPPPAGPQAHPRFEVWVGGSGTPSTTGGTVASTYAAPLVSGTGTGAASQTLSLEASGALGFDGGVRGYLTPHVGVEASVSRSSSTLSGTNAPYALSLEYIARQPPSYEPKTYQFARTVDWDDTAGTQRVTTWRFGPVIRWTMPSGPVSGTVSGGLSLQRHTGAITSLAYTEFHLGGHSTLFYSEHRVEIEPDPDTWSVRPYVAADARLRLAERVGLIGGVRLRLGSDPSVRALVVGLVDPDDDVFVPTLPTVQAAIEPHAVVKAAGARWQAFGGLVIVLR